MSTSTTVINLLGEMDAIEDVYNDIFKGHAYMFEGLLQELREKQWGVNVSETFDYMNAGEVWALPDAPKNPLVVCVHEDTTLGQLGSSVQSLLSTIDWGVCTQTSALMDLNVELHDDVLTEDKVIPRGTHIALTLVGHAVLKEEEPVMHMHLIDGVEVVEKLYTPQLDLPPPPPPPSYSPPRRGAKRKACRRL